MVFHNESFRGGLLFLQGASRQFINPIARMAMKVVVVGLVGEFIKGPEGRMADLPEPAAFHEQFQVSVDRCLVEGFHHSAAVGQNIFNAQGSVLLLEDLFDGAALRRFSLHLRLLLMR